MAPLAPTHRPGCARLGIARLKAFRLNVYEPIPISIVGGIVVGTAPGTGLRIEGASVDQILNDQVDTASFRTRGFVPVAGQALAVYSGDADGAQQLFGGRIIETTQLYESRKQNVAHDLRCVDPTWLLNRRTVLEHYREPLWAYDIVAALVDKYGRGITRRHLTIPRALPYLIDEITFTNEYLAVCFTTVAERIGAHWYLDYDDDLHFFVDDDRDANAITDATPHGAADLQLTEDLSQVATKVIGRGGGARCAIDTPPGETELPVDESDETWYASGLVETGAQVIQYAGIRGRGGRGAFVGSGNAPSGAPTPTPAAGSSHALYATYQYAASFTTAAGETLAGPLAAITLLPLAPVAPPAVTARSRGAGSYPPGMLSPGASTISFAVQISYVGGTIGPLSPWSPTYTWDGNDWEVYVGPWQHIDPTDTTKGWYFPLLEPAGPIAPINWVACYRKDNSASLAWISYYSPNSLYPGPLGWQGGNCVGYASGVVVFAPTGVGAVLVRNIPISKVPSVTGRKLYRTTANGASLKLLATLANNSATEYSDGIADAALGAAPPAADTSGVKDDGQVNPGATALPVSSTVPFAEDIGPGGGGGWVRVGAIPVRYASIGNGVLQGIPASGVGALTATVTYGTQVLVQPRLYGVPPAGPGAILASIARGDTVTIRIERIDIAARDVMAARLATPGVPVNPDDGVIEIVVSDARFGLDELQDHVEATLQERKDPQLTITFTSRDLSLQVGRLITVHTSEPPIDGTFRIHKIGLSEIAISGARATVHPLKTVEASSRIYKFTDLLRRLRSIEGGVR